MTTVEPLLPSTDGPLLPATTAVPVSYVRPAVPMPMVRVNLLPAEVVATRRGHRTRRVVLIALVVLVLLLAAVSFVVRGGIGSTRDQLAAAQAVNTNLRAQQTKYSDVVTAQGAVAATKKKLGDLTSADVDWAGVDAAIAVAAPSGLAVTGVEGTGASDSGTAGSVGGAPGGTGTTPTDPVATTAVATVTITGTALDPATVAAYVDTLSTVPGFANVAATNVYGVEGVAYGFEVAIDLTPAALTKRYATAGGR